MRNLTVVQLTVLLKEAAEAHHEFEKHLGHPDPDWPAWYAAYVCSQLERASASEPDVPQQKVFPPACGERD